MNRPRSGEIVGFAASPPAFPAKPPMIAPAAAPNPVPTGPATVPTAAPAAAPPAAAPIPVPTGCAPGSHVIGSLFASPRLLVSFIFESSVLNSFVLILKLRWDPH